MKQTKPARLQFNPAKYHYSYRVTEGKIGGVTFTHITCPELGKFKPIEMSREQAFDSKVVTALLHRRALAISRGRWVQWSHKPYSPLPAAVPRSGGYRTWEPPFIISARLFLCDVLAMLSPDELFQWQTMKSRGGSNAFVRIPVPGTAGETALIPLHKTEINRPGHLTLDTLAEYLEQLGYQATIANPSP